MYEMDPNVVRLAQERLDARLSANRARLERLSDKHASKAIQLAPELSFDDIWAPEPEAQLVVPGWGIGPGPVHLVTGSWYTGKTLLLATLGLSVAAGKDLFGLWQVRQGKWMHFDHEMGRRLLKRYVQRLRRGMGVDVEALRGQMSLRCLPRLNLRTKNAVDLYSELLTGYSIATFDPLRAAAPGADENKSEFREYLDLLSIVSDQTGCAIIVLHHGGKPQEGTERRNTGRGTSAIDDAVQSKFVLTTQEKGAPMRVSHEKSREVQPTLDDFFLEFVNGTDSVHLEHRMPEELAQASSQKADSKLDSVISRVGEEFIKRGGRLELAKDDIRALVAVNNLTFNRAWAEAKSRGLITRVGTYHSPAWLWHPVPGSA